MISAIYKIGKAVSGVQEPVDCLLKSVKADKFKKGNKTEIKNYVLKIIFDLVNNKIIINSENLTPFDDERSRKRFVYCGNNGGRERQFYVTRELKSSDFLRGKTLYDLRDKLKVEYEKTCEDNFLYYLVNEIIESPLYDDENQAINLKTVEGIKEEYIDWSLSKLITKLTGLKGNEKIVLVTPAVSYKGSDKPINLAELKEYKDLVLTKLKQKKVAKSKSKDKADYCYLCKEAKPSSSDNLKKIKMKLFTTTTINSASGIKYYDKNYRICIDCLEKLLAAESFIKSNMGMKIAGTPTYLIPSILNFEEEILPKYFEKLHSQIELAFNETKFEQFTESVKGSAEDEDIELNFSLDFLSYETDGKYFKVINHIHDVPELYFSKLVMALAKQFLKYEKEIKKFSLASIYHLFSIKYKKDGSIADTKNKTLLFYSQLLGERKIEINIIFSYFCEAMYHLYMNQQDVYKNLWRYEEKQFDFAIKDYFYRYLVLINTLEELNLIDRENAIMEKEQDTFELSDDIETFLLENKFNDQQKALFYLGMLIKQVAYSQYRKEHKKKPILKKISYQGMSVADLKRLYVDVFEKLVQYESLYLNIENINSLCKKYFDKSDASWNLSEFENVFYLLSGYAYGVANTKKDDDSDNDITEGEGKNE